MKRYAISPLIPSSKVIRFLLRLILYPPATLYSTVGFVRNTIPLICFAKLKPEMFDS